MCALLPLIRVIGLEERPPVGGFIVEARRRNPASLERDLPVVLYIRNRCALNRPSESEWGRRREGYAAY